MEPGDVVGGRFEIIRLTGTGGMGAVFLARDRARDELVAVKALIDGRRADRARFEREAEALSELHHPGIVQYVAHGEGDLGEPYLVMEWLEGEDSSSRLRRGPLRVEESVALGMRVAETLGTAHAQGIVHRDLKPSNLFLVHRSVDRVKVLDFGIAWLADTTRMTQTGIVLGTPGYMAPEQTRAGADIDARADVFSLGCVLFECLTGVRAFVGEHVMALLAKILFEEVPPVRSLRPAVPAALDALVLRMLAKDPSLRPRHGLEVAEALSALDSAAWSGSLSGAAGASGASGARSSVAPALTAGERRLLSVVLFGREEIAALDVTQTVGNTGMSPMLLEMRRAAEAGGGRLELLVDGSVLVTIIGTGIATDLAMRAARCALSLREFAEGRPIALATGRGEVTGKMPLGDAIDRAAGRLARRAFASRGQSATSEPGRTPVAIDSVTAGLLDGRFEVKAGEHGLELHGERERGERVRTLLGKPTACVGRDRELATLRALFNECIEEPVARVAVVTAAPGIGKTRLAHELIAEIRARPFAPAVEIWSGGGDSMRVGSSFGLLGQVLRGAAGIRQGDPLSVRQEKLAARVAQHVAAGERQRVTEFLGEVVGTLFPDDVSAPLKAARQDAQRMGEQMRHAWEDFLAAECAAHPVLIVLDDLHWGDLPTTKFIGAALGSLKTLPWMVVALARPEVHELFPRLWVERDAQQIRLDQLTRRAGEKLVKQVLGADVSQETVDRLVGMSDGNAFYLEELIRAVAEGRSASLPETVVAMVEARLEGLEAEARRVLRAASIFGEVFWQGGVEALLGGVGREAQIGEWLSLLVEREVLVQRPDSRFPGEVELAFRHALVREGAYAMLTEEDRALGHKLAAAFLEARGDGESEPLLLAEHCERGGEPGRAGAFYLRAAEQAMRGGDTGATIICAERGLATGVPDAVRVALLGVLCESYLWRNQLSTAEPYVEEVMRLAIPGSAPWARAFVIKLADARERGAVDEFTLAMQEIQRIEPSVDAVAALLLTMSMAIFFLESLGQYRYAEAILGRLQTLVAPLEERDPVARGWFNMVQTLREAWVHEDFTTALRRAEVTYTSLKEANHPRSTMIGRMQMGLLWWLLGALPQAEMALRETLVVDELGMVASLRYFCLIEVLIARGEHEEARQEALRLIALGRESRGPVYEGYGRWGMADLRFRQGALVDAEREAREAITLLGTMPVDQMAAMATLSAIELAAGKPGGALATAEAMMARYEAFGVFGFRGALARLVHVEALIATGDTGNRARAAEALRALGERIAAQAARISDAELRRSFLEEVPENVRIRQLLGS